MAVLSGTHHLGAGGTPHGIAQREGVTMTEEQKSDSSTRKASETIFIAAALLISSLFFIFILKDSIVGAVLDIAALAFAIASDVYGRPSRAKYMNAKLLKYGNTKSEVDSDQKGVEK